MKNINPNRTIRCSDPERFGQLTIFRYRARRPFLMTALILLVVGYVFSPLAHGEISLGDPTTFTAASIGANGPQGLAYHPGRNSIYVLDDSSKMIEIDLAGNVVQSFNLGFMLPGGGVSYDPVSGQLLVTNDLKVFQVTSNGSSIVEIVDLDGDVFASEGIAVDPQNGHIWIADDDNEEIVQVDRTGVFHSSFSTRDILPSFIEPTGLSFHGEDLLIADDKEGTHSLYLVSRNGQLRQNIGDLGVFGVTDPEGVTAVGESHIWICGDADNKIVRLRRLDTANQPPVADAGPGQTRDEGSVVTLDGSGSSDLDDDLLSYSWQQKSGPNVALSNANEAIAAFVAPNVAANTTLIFELTVGDGQAEDTDATSVVIQDTNRAPVADAGPGQTRDEGSVVTLDGSESFDLDDDPLTYSWQQKSGPTVVLSNANETIATFTAPNVAVTTTLSFELTVSDGQAQDTDITNVTVENVQTVNRAPEVDIGPDQVVKSGQVVTLDAFVSDPDGDPLTLKWTQTGGPAVTLSNTNTATTSFVAPSAQTSTEMSFRLQANDGKVNASDEVTVTVTQELTIFYFAQVADGLFNDLRFQSSLILVSKSVPVTVQVDFYDSEGAPLELELGDLGKASSFSIELEAGEAVSLQTPGTEAGVRVGYARVTADAQLGGTVVFTRTDVPSGAILYEAGVPASQTWTDFRIFVDSMGVRDTGLAILHPENQGTTTAQADAIVTLSLYDKSFNLLDEEILQLAPGEHLPRYIFQLFPQVTSASEMEGVLVVSSDQPLAAITLRQNDAPGQEFPEEVPVLTTFPVVP